MRVVLGVIFMIAGWGKVFGGMHEGLAAAFAGTLIGLPAWAFLVVGLLELVGGLLLIAGVLTASAAIPLAIIMFVASIVQWTGMVGDGGFMAARLDLLMVATLVLLALAGGGKLSLEQLWKKPKRKKSKK